MTKYEEHRQRDNVSVFFILFKKQDGSYHEPKNIKNILKNISLHQVFSLDTQIAYRRRVGPFITGY